MKPVVGTIVVVVVVVVVVVGAAAAARCLSICLSVTRNIIGEPFPGFRALYECDSSSNRPSSYLDS